MHRLASIALFLLLAPLSAPPFAHSGAAAAQGESGSRFKVEKISERVYCLFGPGGNVGVLVTDAGVVVVDDQYENVAQGIVDEIRALTDKPIRYLINTHYHADHTGGNAVFVKLTEIIAHDNVRPRLLEYPKTIRTIFPGKIAALERELASIANEDDPYRDALQKDVQLMRFFLTGAEAFRVEAVAPPGLTYGDHVRIWIGGHEVRVFHVGPGHTDGDSMVYFSDENVLHMGDLFFNGMYPFIDVEGGGSASGYIRSIDHAISIARPDAKVIAGHGPVSDVAGLSRLRSFLVDVTSRVKRAVDEGKSKSETVRAIRMTDYPEIKPLFRSLGNVVTAIFDEIKAER